MLLYIIQLEPFLWTLHRALPGLDVAGIVELAFAYVDDVDILGDDDEDIVMADGIYMAFMDTLPPPLAARLAPPVAPRLAAGGGGSHVPAGP